MKIFMGCIAWRQIEQAHHSSVIELFQECGKRGIEIVQGNVVGDALVSRARSLAASAFLRSDCDVLLSIDSDIWFRAEDAIELCEQALAGHDIIGALYMTRNIQTQPAMMLPNEPVVFAPGQKPFEAQFVSTGFCAVTRVPFAALSKTLPHCHKTWRQGGQDASFWPFYMPFTMEWPEDGHIYLSEDWAFCQRAKEAGFKLWVHPGLRVGHIGSYMYTLEDLLRPERARPQPLKLERSPQGKLVTQFMKQVAPDLHSLPGDVAAYLNIEKPEKLAQELAQGKQQLSQLWETKPETETEKAFYHRGDVGHAFLLDLASWHLREPMLSILTDNLMPLANKGWKILDHGSGIGTMALMLASGNQVDCLEPNRYMRKFTEWRANRLGREISFVNKLNGAGGYDLAISFNVLEHVPDPKVTAKELVTALKPGGLLFADASFANDSPLHHICESDPQGAQCWRDEGLERINNLWWRKPGKGTSDGTEDRK